MSVGPKPEHFSRRTVAARHSYDDACVTQLLPLQGEGGLQPHTFTSPQPSSSPWAGPRAILQAADTTLMDCTLRHQPTLHSLLPETAIRRQLTLHKRTQHECGPQEPAWCHGPHHLEQLSAAELPSDATSRQWGTAPRQAALYKPSRKPSPCPSCSLGLITWPAAQHSIPCALGRSRQTSITGPPQCHRSVHRSSIRVTGQRPRRPPLRVSGDTHQHRPTLSHHHQGELFLPVLCIL